MGQSCPDITNNTTDPSNPSDWRGNDPAANPFVNLDPNMVDARFDGPPRVYTGIRIGN